MEDPVQKPADSVKQNIPISVSPNKEAGPVLVSDKEPTLHPEVEAAGVEVVHDTPKLDKVHEQIGLSLSGASAPAKTEPTGAVTLPMTPQEVEIAEKDDIEDSRKWLGTLLDKIYKFRQMFGVDGSKKVTV